MAPVIRDESEGLPVSQRPLYLRTGRHILHTGCPVAVRNGGSRPVFCNRPL